ncbi:maltose alpha-D-glucosyltransferase [Komagataeibacter rhaeticus]|uniref:maltose alpha-D-glucosyltransferase n=1 Tax=Komagataeibacter rhaeticus TaxID=215221 RepID=UPI00055084DC|nr:maltose alpha-D-glucosyltransferase [Komagataeibacter rhaeticus]MBL7238976.1 maltose alpha-D-glucosyltransferase [Komagataeibacter rhaeticus]PYD54248.1 maltose alpha-D-glucosyltransferase [Komagataeibacter rhaeticus]GBQ15011.1 trehalose synthase [Komagataeibacter rhaeticus DSM 16663]
MKRAASQLSDDPLWYKDAVIYQVHIKSFFDSDNDGIGDFRGLTSRLDYIAELGVNTVWLLPFYPSPRRDDGYDISAYRAVHPDYGTLADVRHFVQAAHARNIRVITELVINHTSDQHPWFQRARQARPGSVARNFYVWSDTPDRYADTRVIFCDTETANWTYDPVAGAFFWHRFYAHQPDLNFDSPHVLTAILGVMSFWLELGIDGLRLDAIPYLVEREGTSNENLPETHAILRRLRTALDARFRNRMLLAEANQWPEDTSEYFGNGDECHMAFHFPLMPRMYLAMAREDRFPITDIMRQTPDIPPGCQWAVFLRNHDELTLEMVTDSERDDMWNTYAADRRARLNLGIRRRLSPLLERDRRRIELLNSLLLSMPGTPVLYYGDEIGMGDNIQLGDRDGVRTPMQWSPDRNGGFSRADPERLVLPVIMDPLYGYAAVNAETQRRDPYSLLNWMRRMLAVRARTQAFGRGVLTFLSPGNRKILAYLRAYADETILCVANLARSAQAVELDLSPFAGRVPVEMIAQSVFPPIGQLPYLLTLPPYGFIWFRLCALTDSPTWHVPAPEPLPELRTLVLRHGMGDVFTPAARQVLEKEILPAYLPVRRWAAARGQPVSAVHVGMVVPLGAQLVLTRISAMVGTQEASYFLPLDIAWESGSLPALPQQLALCRVRRGRRVGYLTDGFTLPALATEFMAAFARTARLQAEDGEIVFDATPALHDLSLPPDAPIHWLSAEQSNSSLVIADRVVLKLLRHLHPGIHPEAEMTAFLTRHGATGIAPYLGDVTHIDATGTPHVLAIAEGFMPNQGDGWSWSVNYLRATATDLALSGDEAAEDRADHIAFFHRLGLRLGGMHALLARPVADAAFAPQAATPAIVQGWVADIRAGITAALDSLEHRPDPPQPDMRALATRLCAERARLLERVEELARGAVGTLMTRIHGDFHLGQVLVVENDVVIIDFEGQPMVPLAERRARHSPLRDVAGLLRSIAYAVETARLDGGETGSHPGAEQSAARSSAYVTAFGEEAGRIFLEGWKSGMGDAMAAIGTTPVLADLLQLFLLEKAAYEIRYEAANRPGWLATPMAGLAALAGLPPLSPEETKGQAPA